MAALFGHLRQLKMVPMVGLAVVAVTPQGVLPALVEQEIHQILPLHREVMEVTVTPLLDLGLTAAVAAVHLLLEKQLRLQELQEMAATEAHLLFLVRL